MVPAQHWVRNFSVTKSDIDHILNLLLEKETPLSSDELIHIVVENRLAREVAKLEEKYTDAVVYNPASSYKVGEKVVFPVLDYGTAVVKDTRPGRNSDYGAFTVISVEFDSATGTREFASELQTEHKLSEEGGEFAGLSLNTLTADEILDEYGEDLIDILEDHLDDNTSLVYLAGKWFPKDLLLDVNEGHLNLAEAVLDINGGGPMKPLNIINEIGGLGKSHKSLQEFSMNYALNEDPRFDEVGPAGEVLWYLVRMEPDGVQHIPPLLHYEPIEHDTKILTAEMLDLEDEIADELSPLKADKGIRSGKITLVYPHRRAGTLPLSANVRSLFPTARRASRVWITLVDKEDNEEFTGWVMPQARYVFGLGPLYAKYALPIGAYVTVERSKEADKVFISLNAYRARSEWVPLMVPSGDHFTFETNKRAIGVDYDDLMILGIDDLETMDAVIEKYRNQTLASLLRMLIPGLGRLNPQGTAHTKTIYSAINVFRRVPPSVVMTTLAVNPDFEYLGDHYWKLVK